MRHIGQSTTLSKTPYGEDHPRYNEQEVVASFSMIFFFLAKRTSLYL